MSDEIRKVAFMGIGRMGTGMAMNILKAGYELSVYNRTAAKMEPLIEAGAKSANSPREAAVGADMVISCLMDDKSVLEVITGENGMLEGLKQGAVHVGATTNSPALAESLAKIHSDHGSTYLAGPVLGRPDAAAAAKLLTFVAGDADAIARCTPVLECYAHQVNNLGPNHRVANTLKLCLNFMAISIVELMGEVYSFAEKGGVNLELMETMIVSLLKNPVFEGYAKRIRERDFDDAAFELKAGFKDVQLMVQTAVDNRAPLNYASLIQDKFIAALAQGWEYRDWSAIYDITRKNAGLD